MKNIKFFDYPYLFKEHETALVNIFKDVSSKGAFIMQEELANFEKRIANYVGSKHVLGVANATDAMQLLLKAGGISDGDEVIFCSHTMIATASAIKFTGATPVPIEAGLDHLIDVKEIEKNITSKTKAIMPTQLNGRVCNMNEIINIAKKYDLQVYEDSAQALGAKYNNICAGNFGIGGCISFYPAKVLGCFGDGGAIICNDDEIYSKVKQMRDHGRNESGDISIWGYNSRLDNLQAAILNYFFDDYDNTIKRRRELASLYHENLYDLESIVLPPNLKDSNVNFDIFQNYEISTKERNSLKDYLSNNGIGTIIQWGGKAVHEFTDLGFTQFLPKTEKIMRESLLLPLNISLSNDDIIYVCEKIRSFCGK
tara:strand:+ start:288 stop:1394 length:1107 start_codon:yes stop_codon:yes gene_type:complete